MVGATGRMGALAQRLIAEADDLELHAAIGSGDAIDGIDGADIVFDVTVPAVSPDIVNAALDRGIPVLVGTSGWTAERIATLQRRVAADAQPGVVIVPNFSLGSALATAFAVLAAPVVRVHRDRREPPRGQGRLALRHRDPHRRADRPRAHRCRSGRGTARRPARPRPAGRERPDPQPAASGALGPAGGRLRRRRRDAAGHARHPRRRLVRGRASCSGCAPSATRRGVVVGLDKLLDLGLPELSA